MNPMDTEGSPLPSIQRERWFQQRTRLLQWWMMLTMILDYLTGMTWVWGLNLLPMICLAQGFGYMNWVAETTWVLLAALTSCVTGFVELAGGITRITTDYENFLFCHDSQDYACQTVLGSVNVALAASWLLVSLLWMHIMTRVFRPSLWIRWNPTVSILFLSGIATLMEVLGGCYHGWIFNLFCLVCQYMGRTPESDEIQVPWYTAAAVFALISTLVQSVIPLKEIWADEYNAIYCSWISRRHFNCGEDLDAVCVAGAVCWLVVSLLCWRLVCRSCCVESSMADGNEEYGEIMPSLDDDYDDSNDGYNAELEDGSVES